MLNGIDIYLSAKEQQVILAALNGNTIQMKDYYLDILKDKIKGTVERNHDAVYVKDYNDKYQTEDFEIVDLDKLDNTTSDDIGYEVPKGKQNWVNYETKKYYCIVDTISGEIKAFSKDSTHKKFNGNINDSTEAFPYTDEYWIIVKANEAVIVNL